MAEETYPAVLQAMIDRAGSLTTEETKALGDLWESDNDFMMPEPSFFLVESKRGFTSPQQALPRQ
jgi:hypothetical protein